MQLYAIDANAKAAPWRELAASLHARTPHVAVLGDAGAPGADACDAVLWRDGTAAPDSSKQARVLACEIDHEGVDRVLDILWHCAVVGGHALLEVSANAEGSLAAAALTKLAALGVWQRCNHEALDGVQALANAGIATNQPLPACTWRTLDGETRVYAFAPGGSTTNELRVPDLGLEPLRACVLGGDAATVTRERDGFVLRWQSVAGIRPVLRLDLRGAWRR